MVRHLAGAIGAVQTPRTLDLGRVKIVTAIEHSAIVIAVVETAGHRTFKVLSPARSADLGKQLRQHLPQQCYRYAIQNLTHLGL